MLTEQECVWLVLFLKLYSYKTTQFQRSISVNVEIAYTFECVFLNEYSDLLCIA